MVATDFMRSHSLVRASAGLAAALLAVMAAGPAFGQASGSWIVDADGDWRNVPTNWLNGIEARGAATTASFDNDITATRTVNLNAQTAVGTIIFGDADTSTAAGWIVAGTSNLDMNNSTASATITVNALGTGSKATISAPIIGGVNAPTIVKNGVGTLVLSNAANNFSSKLAITAGTLEVSADRNLGATGSFAADRITISNGATLATTAGFGMNSNRGFTIGSGGGNIVVGGTSNLVVNSRFRGAGETVTVTGSTGFSLSGSSATASNVNWDFSTDSGQRVFFNGSNALGTGTVLVRNGVRLVSQLTALTGGQVTNAVTLESGAGLTARDSAGAVTYTNVTLPSSGSLVFNKDDLLTAALTIASGQELTGNLTIDTSQQAANAVGDVTLSGVFSGASGGITKIGDGASGRLILAGANTYAGNTVISTGTLALGAAGSIANSVQISAASGATFDVSEVAGFTLGALQTLSGAGSVVGAMTASGTLSPGLSGAIGTLSLANSLTMGIGGILDFQLNGTDTTVGGTVNDLLLVGDLTLAGTLNVAETSENSFLSADVGDAWRLFDYTGTLTDNTLSLGTMPTLGSGLTFGIDTTTPNQVNLVVVPEPATMVLVVGALGLAGVAAARLRWRGAGS